MHIDVRCILFLVLPISIILSGCMQFFTFYPTECSSDLPIENVIYKKGPALPFNGSYTSYNMWGNDSEIYTDIRPPLELDKDAFLSKWGEPDEVVYISNDEEILVYNYNLWCGVIIWVAPLVLPVCDGYERVKFVKNKATHVDFRKTNSAGGVVTIGVYLTYGPSSCPSGTDFSLNKPQERTE